MPSSLPLPLLLHLLEMIYLHIALYVLGACGLLRPKTLVKLLCITLLCVDLMTVSNWGQNGT